METAEMMAVDTEVSCGVHQLYGFFPHEDSLDGLSRTKKDVVHAIYIDMHCGRRLSCAQYVFSDIAEGPGDLFGKWLRKTYPDNVTTLPPTKNPNSGSMICTYLWRPVLKDLRSWPEWRAGIRRAKAHRYNGNYW